MWEEKARMTFDSYMLHELERGNESCPSKRRVWMAL